MATHRRRVAVFLAFLLVSISGGQALALTFGSIARDVREELEDFQEIIEFLDAHSEQIGVEGVDMYVAQTRDAMVQSLRNGEVDIYVDSPLIGALIARATGAKPFLRRWKKGVAEYHTLMVVRADSDIDHLADLRGKLVAFDDPFSSSGYLIPKSMLLAQGLETQEILNSRERISDDKVGFIFSNDDNNTVYWIFKGRTDAGAVSPKEFAKFDKKVPGALKILARSIDVPRHVLLHGEHVETATVDALGDFLVAMEQSEEGRAILKKFQKTARFDRFPQGVEATFAPIEQMLDLLDGDLGG